MSKKMGAMDRFIEWGNILTELRGIRNKQEDLATKINKLILKVRKIIESE